MARGVDVRFGQFIGHFTDLRAHYAFYNHCDEKEAYITASSGWIAYMSEFFWFLTTGPEAVGEDADQEHGERQMCSDHARRETAVYDVSAQDRIGQDKQDSGE
jgi:hypothetical protein